MEVIKHICDPIRVMIQQVSDVLLIVVPSAKGLTVLYSKLVTSLRLKQRAINTKYTIIQKRRTSRFAVFLIFIVVSSRNRSE